MTGDHDGGELVGGGGDAAAVPWRGMTGMNPEILGGDISAPLGPTCLGLLRVGEVDGGWGDPEG